MHLILLPLLAQAAAAPSITCEGGRELCRVVIAAETQFAGMLATSDPAPFVTHLDDAAVYVTADGKRRSKAEMIALVRGAPPHASARLDRLWVRQFGAVAIAMWTESWADPGGSPSGATISGLDTWRKRGGHWKVVATREVRD